MPLQHDENKADAADGDKAKLAHAATAKFGRSSTLVKGVPSRYPTPLPLHLKFMARLLSLVIPSLFVIGPAMLVAPLFLLVMHSPSAAFSMLLVDIVLAFYPAKEWPVFRQYFQLWYELFDFHHNIDVPLQASTRKLEDTALTIFSTHPHGVIPLHGYLWCAICDQLFQERYGFGALADIATRLPLLRHTMSWLATTSATKSVLMKRMGAGKNLYILPGGVSEIFLACPGRHVIKAPRRGLMKLALQTGAVLVPTYVFGANDFFNQSATYRSSSAAPDSRNKGSNSDTTNWIGKVQRKISRAVRGGFTFFWGQYGLPLPYEAKCCMVLGDPIEPVPGTLGQGLAGGKVTCRRIEEPTEKQIDELLYQYTDALVRLFEQYKAQAGFPNAELIFE